MEQTAVVCGREPERSLDTRVMFDVRESESAPGRVARARGSESAPGRVARATVPTVSYFTVTDFTVLNSQESQVSAVLIMILHLILNLRVVYVSSMAVDK